MFKSLSVLIAAVFMLAGYGQNSDAAPLQSSAKEAGSAPKTMPQEASGKKEMTQPAAGSAMKSQPQKEMQSGSGTKKMSGSPKGDKPAASDGWIIVEDDFWYPFRYSLADAIHNAHVNFRNGRETAASDEIKKAISWMKLAKGMAANKESEEDIATTIADLQDLAMFLSKGASGSGIGNEQNPCSCS